MLVEGLGDIEYNGDPLLDFSMTNFLERIAFKNPKSQAKLSKAIKVREADVSEPANKEKSAKIDEQFFNKYFDEKQ